MNPIPIAVRAIAHVVLLVQTGPPSVPGGALTVEGDSSCPNPAQVQALVNERWPATGRPDSSSGSGSGWQLRLDARSRETASSSGTVDGTLVDGSGTVRERKQLTVSASECDAAALAFASMVDRFFRGLAWSSNAPLPAPAASPEAAPVPSQTPWVFAAELSAGAGALVDGAASAHALAGLAVTATKTDVGRLRLDILAGWPPRHRQEIPEGGATASEDSWPLRAALVFSAPRQPVAWQGGIDALVTADQATASGIVQPGIKRRLTLALGLTAGILIAVGGSWSLLAEVAADRHIAGTKFYIPGDAPTQTIILEPPGWRALIAARAVYSFGS